MCVLSLVSKSPSVLLQVMEAASRSALLVRCGARSSAGLLLDGHLGAVGEGEGNWRPEGAFVLAPGLLLLGAGVDVDDEPNAEKMEKMARRVPAISVVMRRGRIQVRPAGGSECFLVFRGCLFGPARRR